MRQPALIHNPDNNLHHQRPSKRPEGFYPVLGPPLGDQAAVGGAAGDAGLEGVVPELAQDDILGEVGEVAGAEIAIVVAGGRDVVVQVVRPVGDHRRLREPGRHQIAQCHQSRDQSASTAPTAKTHPESRGGAPTQSRWRRRRLRVQAKTGEESGGGRDGGRRGGGGANRRSR